METFSNDIYYLAYIIPGYILVATFRYFNQSSKSGQFELIVLSLVWGTAVFIAVTAVLGYWIVIFAGRIQASGLAVAALVAITSSVAISIPAGFFGAWIARRELFHSVKQLFIGTVNG